MLDVHYENTGERLSLADIKTYSIEDYVGEQYKKDFYKIFLDKQVWERVKLLPNCVDVIKKLHDDGYEIYFVTATDTANIHKKFGFLQRDFPFINVKDRLICAHNKQMIKVDVLIDDCLDNLIGGEYESILFDYPWNRHFDIYNTYDCVYRAYRWKDVFKIIRGISGNRYGY